MFKCRRSFYKIKIKKLFILYRFYINIFINIINIVNYMQVCSLYLNPLQSQLIVHSK